MLQAYKRATLNKPLSKAPIDIAIRAEEIDADSYASAADTSVSEEYMDDDDDDDF